MVIGVRIVVTSKGGIAQAEWLLWSAGQVLYQDPVVFTWVYTNLSTFILKITSFHIPVCFIKYMLYHNLKNFFGKSSNRSIQFLFAKYICIKKSHLVFIHKSSMK